MSAGNSGTRRSLDTSYTQDYDGFEDANQFKARKRPRGGMLRQAADFGDEGLPPALSTRAISVSDEKELWDFYEQRFKDCQQTACKLIAKAWIKAVEPKKQSTHPYTGSDEKAPDWWPQPWGSGKEDRVRHKEPDHLYKRERVHLLNHILRMIVVPNNQQHADLKKLNLNVAKLKDVTNEALSGWFTDKDNPNNALKKPKLDEIFKVAAQEERFRHGQIGPTTKVHVKSDDRPGDGYASDRDETSQYRAEEEQENTPISSRVSPARIPTTQSISFNGPGQSPNHIQSNHFMADLPARDAFHPQQSQHHHHQQQAQQQQHQQIFDSHLAAEQQQHYVDNSGLGGHTAPPLHSHGGFSDMSYANHDTSRRPSMIPTPTTYHSPVTSAANYEWATTTQLPNATFPSHPAPSHASLMPPNMQHYILGDMARDQNPAHAFRPDGMHSGHMGHPSGYQDYVHQDARGLSGGGIKLETQGHNMLT
ncbi:hypothetical protein PG993_006391 [Apiospora rasikravindrae]|uniref:Subtelomeric hrmA-associated cluster protein AFUB-079030/YDR124W-like helical bundle domain-containing protein n=1 Tax=Apiospora rasikravindrae TaxID=990691 RepID=A0ABR1T825_9PEZI